MAKKQYSSFEEELQDDYRRAKKWYKTKKWIMFILWLPILLIALIFLLWFLSGIIGALLIR